jgi:glycosyltransferase involved in cell wall biosynthesis
VGDGPLQKEVSNDIARLDRGIEVSGWIDRDMLPDLLNDVKILVMPSIKEGLPNTLLEAMACGTVVLATPVGGIPDLIQNNVSGFIINQNSPQEIANTIQTILKNPELHQISNHARSLVLENFTFQKTRMNYSKILDRS